MNCARPRRDRTYKFPIDGHQTISQIFWLTLVSNHRSMFDQFSDLEPFQPFPCSLTYSCNLIALQFVFDPFPVPSYPGILLLLIPLISFQVVFLCNSFQILSPFFSSILLQSVLCFICAILFKFFYYFSVQFCCHKLFFLLCNLFQILFPFFCPILLPSILFPIHFYCALFSHLVSLPIPKNDLCHHLCSLFQVSFLISTAKRCSYNQCLQRFPTIPTTYSF